MLDEAGLFVDFGEILDNWRKKIAPKKYIDAAEMAILEHEKEIERIERETAGSSDKH